MHSHSHELLTLFGRERAVIVGRREVASDGRGSVPYRDEQEAHGKKGEVREFVRSILFRNRPHRRNLRIMRQAAARRAQVRVRRLEQEVRHP